MINVYDNLVFTEIDGTVILMSLLNGLNRRMVSATLLKSVMISNFITESLDAYDAAFSMNRALEIGQVFPIYGLIMLIGLKQQTLRQSSFI